MKSNNNPQSEALNPTTNTAAVSIYFTDTGSGGTETIYPYGTNQVKFSVCVNGSETLKSICIVDATTNTPLNAVIDGTPSIVNNEMWTYTNESGGFSSPTYNIVNYSLYCDMSMPIQPTSKSIAAIAYFTNAQPVESWGSIEITESTPYSDWSEVASIQGITLQFYEDPNVQNATIYGNGLNQVALQLIINTCDKHDNPIQVLPKQIFENVKLCDYGNKNLINLDSVGNVNNDNWVYTGTQGQYHTAIYPDDNNQIETPSTNAPSIATYYLYWASTSLPSAESKTIAVCGNLSDGTPFGSYKFGSNQQTSSPIVKVTTQNTYKAADTKITATSRTVSNRIIDNYYISFNQDRGAATQGFVLSGCDYTDSLSNPMIFKPWKPDGLDYSIATSLPGLILNMYDNLINGNIYDTYTTTLWNFQEEIETPIPYTTGYGPDGGSPLSSLSLQTTDPVPVNEKSNPNSLCISMVYWRNNIQSHVKTKNYRFSWGNVVMRDQYGNPCYAYFEISNVGGVTIKDGPNNNTP